MSHLSFKSHLKQHGIETAVQMMELDFGGRLIYEILIREVESLQKATEIILDYETPQQKAAASGKARWFAYYLIRSHIKYDVPHFAKTVVPANYTPEEITEILEKIGRKILNLGIEKHTIQFFTDHYVSDKNSDYRISSDLIEKFGRKILKDLPPGGIVRLMKKRGGLHGSYPHEVVTMAAEKVLKEGTSQNCWDLNTQNLVRVNVPDHIKEGLRKRGLERLKDDKKKQSV